MTDSKRQLEEENHRLRERLKRLETTAPKVKNAFTERVITATCKHFGITRSDLHSQTREPVLVRARWTAAIVIKRMYPWISTNEIGSALSRDHSTVLASLRHSKDKDLQEHLRVVGQAAKRAEEADGT